MSENQRSCSDFLVAKSSFWNGFGSAINIRGSHFPYNYSQSAEQADMIGIHCDWNMVGQDIQKPLEDSFNAIKSEVGNQLEIF